MLVYRHPQLAPRPRDFEPEPNTRREHYDAATLRSMLERTAERLRTVELPRLRYPSDRAECRAMIRECQRWARELVEPHQLRGPRRRAG